MKDATHQTSSVAWFKLADIIARGEKERALSVHKLLMHSVEDKALVYQLEGDILLSFHDGAALDRYHSAAALYKKDGKMQQAASVYEYALSWKQDLTILEALLDVYKESGNYEAMLLVAYRFMVQSLKQNMLHVWTHVWYRYRLELEKIYHGPMMALLVRALVLYDNQNIHIKYYIEETLDAVWLYKQEDVLLELLSDLETYDKNLYEHAIVYYEERKGNI